MSDLKHRTPNELVGVIRHTEANIERLNGEIANGEANLAYLDGKIADLKASRDKIATETHRRRSWRAGAQQRLIWAEHYFEEKTSGD